ncbi:MAG: site-specific DNA-methyltransferase [bacterium]|nr:site-specific DNA-methyltransferase [bacterium]
MRGSHPTGNIQTTRPRMMPEIQIGDVWHLGPHRVLCGDCTYPALLEEAFVSVDGIPIAPRLMVADPPYNIGIAEWDRIPEYTEWWLAWWNILGECMSPDHSAYVFGQAETLAEPFVRVSPPKRWLIWHYTNRNTPNVGTWGRSHDAIIYVRRGDAPFYRDRARVPYFPGTKSGHTGSGSGRFPGVPFRRHPDGAQPRDVIVVPALAAGAGTAESVNHPTQKPIALIRTLIDASSDEGDVVVDPFGGSGTTLMACEELGRVCITIEQNPEYVGLILDRWTYSTGRAAQRIHNPVSYRALESPVTSARSDSRQTLLFTDEGDAT